MPIYLLSSPEWPIAALSACRGATFCLSSGFRRLPDQFDVVAQSETQMKSINKTGQPLKGQLQAKLGKLDEICSFVRKRHQRRNVTLINLWPTINRRARLGLVKFFVLDNLICPCIWVMLERMKIFLQV